MKKTKPQCRLSEYRASSPFLTYVLLGFLVSYLFFFIRPIFLNPAHTMRFFKYVPKLDPIGCDLRLALGHSEEWFVAKQTPYTGSSLYPPLTSVLFTSLLSVDLPTAYAIITIITLVCYIFITLAFPLWTSRQRHLSPLLMLFFVSGLFSYGFQFELERGQFNVITMFLCLFAVWIYHYRYRYRYLAYSMFSLSIQLKVFPAIFIVMFVKDWKDWKNNIKRVLGLAVVNFALFFVLGPQIFIDFLKAIKAQSVRPYVWVGNHSIRSFVTLFSKESSWMKEYSGLVEVLLLGAVAVCIFLIMLQAYRQRQNDINPHLLLACTIGTLLIPPVSHDYKLSLLTAPVAVVFYKDYFTESTNRCSRLIISLLTFVFCIAYSSTLFSFTNKPLILLNNQPALMVMLFVTTAFSLMSKPRYEMQS